ncbi:hypothetical protein [Devosia ginsengisoli]|uniref:hypothetical protein n=1 Tax=Devosia ginsengisoli TaxID=400770 RepID=UPI0026F2D978|nr:hypothetical protein [Devosia ginsengisoli]MCR6672059.1 hypothetical protein [Devosia ginsengisoli]
MILLIKEHEPIANMTASGNKPWRTQKMFLDLTREGVDCRLFMSSFDHWTKTQTSRHQLTAEFSQAELLHAPGYPRNNSILRLVSGVVFAFRFLLAGLTGPRPSQIVVACPGLLIIMVALLLKLRYGCKVCIDLRDNWPSTLSGFFPAKLRPAVKAGFTWWLAILLRLADDIVVPSENLREFAMRLVDKPIIKIPFLLDRDRVADMAPRDDGGDMMFLGSLNSFFDYDVFEQAASYCAANEIVFHILGDGDFLEDVRGRFAGSDHVHIHGRVSYDEAIAISHQCRIGLYPYRRNMGFDNHETNKLTDYLVMGLVVYSSVPLPIDAAYFRTFPSLPDDSAAAFPSKQDIREYGMSLFVGSYLDRFIASGLYAASP